MIKDELKDAVVVWDNGEEAMYYSPLPFGYGEYFRVRKVATRPKLPNNSVYTVSGKVLIECESSPGEAIYYDDSSLCKMIHKTQEYGLEVYYNSTVETAEPLTLKVSAGGDAFAVNWKGELIYRKDGENIRFTKEPRVDKIENLKPKGVYKKLVYKDPVCTEYRFYEKHNDNLVGSCKVFKDGTKVWYNDNFYEQITEYPWFYAANKEDNNLKGDIQIMQRNYKEEFLSICKQHIKRDGIEELLKWLESTDFFAAPASTKFHSNFEGGLCEHSIKVYDCVRKLLELHPEVKVDEETVAIAALFHDLCKVNFYKETYRNVKDYEGTWIKVKTYMVEEDNPFGDHSDKSLIILQSFMRLKEEEIYAIRGHMGAYDSTAKGGSYLINKIFTKSKFAVLLHLADTESSYLCETTV